MALVNGFDPAAWAIDGARTNAELARIDSYATSGGQEGVVSAGDLKVRQLSSAGTQVIIDPGAAEILNRSANVRNQMYTVNGRNESRVDIRATTGSARNDMVIVRVEDPQYSPWPQPSAADAPTYQYVRPFVVENVGQATKASDLNLGYSALALARIDIPPNTTAITNAMIKEMRKLARPRQWTEVFRHQPAQSYDMPGGTTSTFGHWPLWEPTFVVPDWATHVVASMTATGIYKPVGGIVIGDLRLEFCVPGNAGPPIGNVIFEEDDNSTPRRATMQVSGETNVVADRGKTRSIRIGARRNHTFSAANGKLTATTASNFMIHAYFQERAV